MLTPRMEAEVVKFAKAAAPLFQIYGWKWTMPGGVLSNVEVRVPNEAEIAETTRRLLRDCIETLDADSERDSAHNSTGRILVSLYREEQLYPEISLTIT